MGLAGSDYVTNYSGSGYTYKRYVYCGLKKLIAPIVCTDSTVMEMPKVLLAVVAVFAILLQRTSEAVLLPSSGGNAPVPGRCTGTLEVRQPPRNDSKPIIVTSLFPFPALNTESDGYSNAAPTPVADNMHYLLPAAVIALEELNDRLHGYHLQLDVRDTQCHPYKALSEIISSVEEYSNKRTANLAILGPGCLDATQVVSPIAQRLFLPVVSYGYDTNTPVVSSDSDSDSNTNLFEMVRNVYHTTQTAVHVMHYFGWTERVAFMYDDDMIYTLTVEQLARVSDRGFVLTANDSVEITIPRGIFVELVDDTAANTIRDFMSTVRKNSIRVIAGLMGQDYACQLLCEAKRGTIPGHGFVWVFVGAYQDEWWQNEAVCTCNLTKADVESVILVSSQVKNTSNKTLVSGTTYAELKAKYLERLYKWCPKTVGTKPNTFFSTTYDAVWTIGMAINNTLDLLTEVGPEYTPYGNATVPGYNSSVYEALSNSLATTDFFGASGQVSFSDSGERMGIDVVLQIQDGQNTLVGHFDSQTRLLSITEASVQWPGDGMVPSEEPVEIHKSVSLGVTVVVTIVTFSSIIFAILMLLFTIYYRNHFIIRASGHRLNYFIFTGCFMAYASVLIFALLSSSAGREMPRGLFSFFCILRLYTLPLSFTLTYGTLFARAWRIYRIFNNPFISKRKYSDTHLMLIVSVLALIDIALITIWAAAGSYGGLIARDEVDYDDFSTCVYLGCSSRSLYLIGTGVNSFYKILQMMLFLFIISLVRKGIIERKIYDDSTGLAISLYVSALFVIGLPAQVQLLLTFNIGAALVVNAIWVNLITNVCITAIYVTKFYQIVIKKVDVRKLRTQKSKFYLYRQESSIL